jgi:hypothetical protein
MIREAERVDLVAASYFQPITEGAINVGPLTSSLEADGEVIALFAGHQGNRLIEIAEEEIAEESVQVFVLFDNIPFIKLFVVEFSVAANSTTKRADLSHVQAFRNPSIGDPALFAQASYNR